MPNPTYKLIEITGTSPNSIEEAVQSALAKAGATIRHMRWFEVVETRGAIKESQVSAWQVTVKVGFSLED
jgi:flavin-binding protein dodecin